MNIESPRRAWPMGVADTLSDHARQIDRERASAHNIATAAAMAADRAAAVSADRSAAAMHAADVSRRLDREAVDLALHRRYAELSSIRAAEVDRPLSSSNAASVSALGSLVDGRRTDAPLPSSNIRPGPTSPRAWAQPPSWSTTPGVAGSLYPAHRAFALSRALSPPPPPPVMACSAGFIHPVGPPHPHIIPPPGPLIDAHSLRTAQELRRLLLSLVPSLRPTSSYLPSQNAKSTTAAVDSPASAPPPAGAPPDTPQKSPLRTPPTALSAEGSGGGGGGGGAQGSGGDGGGGGGDADRPVREAEATPANVEVLLSKILTRIDGLSSTASPPAQPPAPAPADDSVIAEKDAVIGVRDDEIRKLKLMVEQQRRRIEQYRRDMDDNPHEKVDHELIQKYKAAVEQYTIDFAKERQAHEADRERADRRVAEERAKTADLRTKLRASQQRVIDLEAQLADQKKTVVEERTSRQIPVHVSDNDNDSPKAD